MTILSALALLNEAVARETGDTSTELAIMLPNKLLFQTASHFGRDAGSRAYAMHVLGSDASNPNTFLQYRYRPETMDVTPYIQLHMQSRSILLLGTEPIAMTMESKPRGTRHV